MQRHAVRFAFVVCATLALSGCSGLFNWGPSREAWRGTAERQCLNAGLVRTSAYIQQFREVDGPADCGADSPFKITAFADGAVALSEPATLNCPMTAAMDEWLTKVVQPQAMAHFGQQVVGLKLLGTYTCRRINGRSFGSMSEHAYMNAIDVAGFMFQDGNAITVARDWKSQEPTVASFLRLVGSQSCQVFNTVIGPDGDSEHWNHFHLDLANRSKSGRRYCAGGGKGAMAFAPDEAADIAGAVIREHGRGPGHDGPIEE
jgi:hypothetical protein